MSTMTITKIGAGPMFALDMVSLEDVFEAITGSEKLAEQTKIVREKKARFDQIGGGDKKHPTYKDLGFAKCNLPTLVPAGVIEGAIKDSHSRITYSGMMSLDFDDLADPAEVRDSLKKVPYIMMAFISPSGTGVKAFATIGPCPDLEYWKAAFLTLQTDLEKRGLEVDATCKNYNRLTFLAHDPDAWLKQDAVPLKVKVEKLTAPAPKPKVKVEEVSPASDISDALFTRFKPLCAAITNRWKSGGYPSQSEADFALAMDICTLTPHPGERSALFMSSPLWRNHRKMDLALNKAGGKVEKENSVKVDFSPVTVDAYLESLKPAPQEGGFPTSLVGTGKFAEPLDFVHGLLIEGAMSVVYGPSNCGKSFWCLHLAAAVATGTDFFGAGTDQGAVLYFGLEGSVGIRNRGLALKKKGLLPKGSPLHQCFSPLSLLDAGHTELVAQTASRIEAESGQPLKLIVVDTYARAMAGGDENNGQDTSIVVARVDAIRAATGAHVMLIHHCGKDEARGARGHSSLRAATDTEIEVTRPDPYTPSVVSVKKQRDLPIGETTYFSLLPVDLGVGRRGDQVTSCIVREESGDGNVEPTKERKSNAGRPSKFSPDLLLELLPLPTAQAWQAKAAELGISRTVFYELKAGLEKAKKCYQLGGSWVRSEVALNFG